MGNKIRLLKVLLICFFSSYGLQAQDRDSSLIREAALNYVQGYYTADPSRMEKSLSPELAKRIIFKDKSGDAIQNMGYSLLLLSARNNKNNNELNPGVPFKGDVIIYDIGTNMATVKVVTNKFRFIDYLHLGRIDGEWKIINVLWEFVSK